MIQALLALQLADKPRIIIVDDNSPDGTGQIADQLAQAHPEQISVLHRETKEGLGPAYIAGFTKALESGAEYIIQMDCDFSHRPEDIPKLIEAADNADLVIGSRFCPGGRVDPSWGHWRKLLSGFANGPYVRLSLGLPVKDATGGFRLWRREALLAIDPARTLTMSGYGFQVEMTYLAHRKGLRITETPIYFPDRSCGDSKMSASIMAEAALQVPTLRWRHRNTTPTKTASPSTPISAGLISVLRSRMMLTIGCLFALALVLRLLVIAFVPLIPEEAYYWMYAKKLELSYFDHPPMIAWVIGLGTAVLGNTELGVRIVGLLLMLASSLLMYRIGAAWFSRRTGIISALLLQILPAFFVVGFIATMDSALIFFWLLCLVGLTRALKDDRPSGWYIAGLALGGALLSKYTGVFLLAGTGMALIVHQPWRKQLLRVHPYLAFLLAVGLFSPVIVWNARHDWASFMFQFVNRFGDYPISTETVLNYLLLLVAVATPMIVWLWIGQMPRLLRPRRFLRPRNIIVLSFSVPLLAVLAYKSLRYEVHINWGMPAILMLIPLATHHLLARMRLLRGDIERWKWARQLTWTALVCLTLNIFMSLFLLLIQPKTWLISAFGPWSELAAKVELIEDQIEHQNNGDEPIVVGDGAYRLASILAFYRNPIEAGHDAAIYTTNQVIISENGLGYTYWSPPPAQESTNCIFVTERTDEAMIEKLDQHFLSIDRSIPPITLANGDSYYVFICHGLKVSAAKHRVASLRTDD